MMIDGRYFVLVAVVATLSIAGCEQHGEEVAAAKAAIAKDARDPDGIEWRDIRAYSDGTVCGAFNEKNAFGGYVGYVEFAYHANELKKGDSDYNHAMCSNDTIEAKNLILRREFLIARFLRNATTEDYNEMLELERRYLKIGGVNQGEISMAEVDIKVRAARAAQSASSPATERQSASSVN